LGVKDDFFLAKPRIRLSFYVWFPLLGMKGWRRGQEIDQEGFQARSRQNVAWI